MDINVYFEAMQNIECAFAYHEVVFNDAKQMIDYTFIEVNRSFELMTGLKKENIINKRYLRDVAIDKTKSQKWVDIYSQVMKNQQKIEFEEYAKDLRSHYLVRAYPTDESHFVTIFFNKNFQKNMEEIAEYLISNMGHSIDYDKITAFAHEVSGADYTIFNLFDEDGKRFTSLASCGINDDTNKILKNINLDIVGHTWEQDVNRDNLIKDQHITHFNDISVLTNKVLPKTLIKSLVKMFKIEDTVVAKITKEKRMLGDFTLLFTKGNKLKNIDLFRLYLLQLGLFIEKTQLEKSLTTSQKQFFTLAEYAPVGFVTCDRNGVISYANKKLLEILDSPAYEATTKINLLTYPNLIKSGFSDKLADCLKNDRLLQHEMHYLSLWGKELWLKIFFTPIKENGEIIGANIVIDDISDKKASEDLLKERAVKDALTRTYNRNAMDTILTDYLFEAKVKQLISCALMVDIDNFKYINDNYGHKAGDIILQYLATRIKLETKEHDLIIRTGGDEFLVYLHDIKDEENANIIIQRILTKISGEYHVLDNVRGINHNIPIQVSVGAAFYPRHGVTAEDLMARADDAMYVVKKTGKAGFHIAE